MDSRRKFYRLAVLLVSSALLLAACGERAARPDVDIDALAAERLAMAGLFALDAEGYARFDEVAAIEGGFSGAAIDLAREETTYANEVLRLLESASADGATLRIPEGAELQGSYPLFDAFTEAVAEREADGGEVDLAATLESQGIPLASEWYCGYIGRSRPSRAAPWRTRSASNPSARLRALGYHSTPGLVGGGWTRPRTYRSWLCGFKTYRDHALIRNGSSFREQNYAGFTPRGEPNPELYRSGPWPYATWPAYVYWWHRKH